MDIFGKNKDNDGTVSLEELENAFRQPTQRQDYYEQQAAPQGEAIPTGLVNPEGPEPPVEINDEVNELSPEKAKRTGERIARLVDTGIDFALSNFVARNDESYRADERDLEDIAECWGEIAHDHDWNIGPEWQLAILYIMVYGPIVKQAITDRRIAELETRQQLQEERLRIMEDRMKEQESNGAEQQQPTPGVFTVQPSKD